MKWAQHQLDYPPIDWPKGRCSTGLDACFVIQSDVDWRKANKHANAKPLSTPFSAHNETFSRSFSEISFFSLGSSNIWSFRLIVRPSLFVWVMQAFFQIQACGLPEKSQDNCNLRIYFKIRYCQENLSRTCLTHGVLMMFDLETLRRCMKTLFGCRKGWVESLVIRVYGWIR